MGNLELKKGSEKITKNFRGNLLMLLFKGMLLGGIFSLACVVNGESTVKSFWNDSVPAGDISLNGELDFTYTLPMAKEIPELPPETAFDVKIKVPGLWDEQRDKLKNTSWWKNAKFSTMGKNTLEYLTGIGWYRTTFDVPVEWKDKSVVLTIGRIGAGQAHVWLNRKHIASYDYGNYTPFNVDLNSRLDIAKTNELIISVDNTKCIGVWSYQGGGGKASGIVESLTIHVSGGQGRIADIYPHVGADLHEVVWELELENNVGAEDTPASIIQWEVNDAKNILAEGNVPVPSFTKQQKMTWKKSIPEIKAWSDREPNLYHTSLKWIVDGKEWDKGERRFGLRKWAYEGRKLFLNSSPVYLRGELGVPCFPNIGMIPTSKEYWLQYLGRMKEIGWNYNNFEWRVAPVGLLEAADELGIIIQTGESQYQLDPLLGKRGTDAYKEVWTPTLCWTRSHPSMCIYIFSAEYYVDEKRIEQLKKQYDFVKSRTSECLILPVDGVRGIEYAFTVEDQKKLTQEPFPHHAKRLEEYTKISDLFGSYIRGDVGYNFFKGPWRELNVCYDIYRRPTVVHETYMRSSYLNPENKNKYTGWIPPWMYVRLENNLKKAGLLERWNTYNENSGKINSIMRKYCMEKVRKCGELAGYEFLGLTDSSVCGIRLYPSGICDEFLQLKSGDSIEKLRKYLGESVLLLDWTGDSINHSFWSEDTFNADIMVSLYGSNPVKNGKLSWELKNGKDVVQKGEWGMAEIANGKVHELKKLEIKWPKVEKTTKLNLAVTLKDKNYQLENDWDFWVLPKQKAPEIKAVAGKSVLDILKGRYSRISNLSDASQEKLWIVSKISEKEVDHLNNGGDVLLLGTKPFPTITTRWWPSIPGMAGRLDVNVGVVINRHKIFDNLPDDGWGDWLFVPIIEPAGKEVIVFDNLPTKFDPILEVISYPADVRKQAAIFEKQVGKGRLFVANCGMDMENPSCVTLMDNILHYVSSSDFHPTDSLDAEILKNLAKGRTLMVNKPEEKEGTNTASTSKNAIWSNKEVCLIYDNEVEYRINDGEWKHGKNIILDKECLNKVCLKKDGKEEVKEIGIDFTKPKIEVITTPQMKQEGGTYYATTNTEFKFNATDELSGVKLVEVAGIRSMPLHYSSYVKPFKLEKGLYKMRCRVTDNVGNVNEIMGGNDLSAETDWFLVEVSEEK